MALLQAVQSAPQPLRAKASQASLVPTPSVATAVASNGAGSGSSARPGAKAQFKAAARVVSLLAGGNRSPFRGGPGSLYASSPAGTGQGGADEGGGGDAADGGAEGTKGEEEAKEVKPSSSAAAGASAAPTSPPTAWEGGAVRQCGDSCARVPAAFRKRALERRASMMVQSPQAKGPSPEAAVAAERAQTEAAEAAKWEEERLRLREEEEKRSACGGPPRWWRGGWAESALTAWAGRQSTSAKLSAWPSSTASPPPRGRFGAGPSVP